VVIEFLHADRQADGRTDMRTNMTKLIVAFRNFANSAYSELTNYKSVNVEKYFLLIRIEILPSNLLPKTSGRTDIQNNLILSVL